jgi:hypothetical protein
VVPHDDFDVDELTSALPKDDRDGGMKTNNETQKWRLVVFLSLRRERWFVNHTHMDMDSIVSFWLVSH